MNFSKENLTRMLETTYADKSSIWRVPGHITGFFEIADDKYIKNKGSRGSGFCIDEYVYTLVEIEDTDQVTKQEIFFNGAKIQGEVSSYVASVFSPFLEGKNLKIHHASLLPIGGGFGTSGAGALGAAFALNELFNSKMKKEMLGQIAHKAEVLNSTGLGDVIAQLKGGAEIRVKPGAPGFGKIKLYNWPDDIQVLAIYLQKMSTKDVITNKSQISKINKAASVLISKMIKNPTVEKFAKYSKTFSEQCGLMSNRVRRLLTELDEKNFVASQIMIGESIFVLGVESELAKCTDYVKKINEEAQFWQGKLAITGPQRVESTEIQ